MFNKNFFIVIGIILLAHYILKKVYKIDNFSNIIEKTSSLIWNKELSPMEINKLKKLPNETEEEEYSNWHNEDRNNYNAAHLDVNTNESEYTIYRDKDEFEGVGYY